MKKFLCALMMAVLALGITACGGAAEQFRTSTRRQNGNGGTGS